MNHLTVQSVNPNKCLTLHSFAKESISEVVWERPEMLPNQIEIKTAFCGVCRSDIGSYMRWEKMPYASKENPNGIVGTFGHEGLGIVTKIGSEVESPVRVGDYVATWCDPAYSEYYYANDKEFVIVPKLDPIYILQPTACAINIAVKTAELATLMFDELPHILLIGSGFMSIVIKQYFDMYKVPITVVGSNNKQIWNSLNTTLVSMDSILESKDKFKCIIDLSSNAKNWDIIPKILDIEGLLCYAATPTTPVTTNFFEQCWNCYTITMPSPRNSDFLKMMELTAYCIRHGRINVDKLWTHGYDRWTQYHEAFEDGSKRLPNYIRGYLKY